MELQQLLDVALAMQAGLISRSESGDYPEYEQDRRALMSDPRSEPLVPAFIRLSRTLDQAFGHMRAVASHGGSWAIRREFVRAEMTPLLEALERLTSHGSALVTGRTGDISVPHVKERLQKALSSVKTDAAGAITKAKSVLEGVCKHILGTDGVSYDKAADLLPLVQQTAKHLTLPLTARGFSGISTLVNLIAEVRNKYGDAHDGGLDHAEPDPELAELVVDLSGAVAVYLLKRWQRTRDG